MLDAALAAEAEAQQLALDLQVAPPQRGEAVGAVLAHVFVVADADQRLVEQAHDRGEDLPAAQVGRAQVALEALAQERQHLAEFQHALELRLVARRPIVGVVAVLLAPARIRAGRLDMTVRVGADPDARPGGRYGEAVDARAGVASDDALAARRVIGPAGADALARDATHAVGDIAQAARHRAAAATRWRGCGHSHR